MVLLVLNMYNNNYFFNVYKYKLINLNNGFDIIHSRGYYNNWYCLYY